MKKKGILTYISRISKAEIKYLNKNGGLGDVCALPVSLALLRPLTGLVNTYVQG